METYTLALIAVCGVAFLAAGIYLHMLRKRSEDVFPAPFLLPAGKRKPRKK
ncbi:MAG: hypothetical protein V1813_02635 [Candidatus Aenigmatarchaeota archaeon]